MQIFVRQHMLKHGSFLQLNTILRRQRRLQSLKALKHRQAIQPRPHANLRTLHQPDIALDRLDLQQPQLL